MNNENNTQFIAGRPATQTPIPPTPVGNQGKAQPLLQIGEQLGNYRLMRLLAQGGFADVYLGEHIHLSTEAAIKVLRTRLSSKDLLTFREEARIVARLHHSHIVTIFDFDVQNGIPFIVMDYAPNSTLRQRHPKGSVLAPATIIPYLKQVADALQHGHDQQIVHRDVKPENMLIGRKNDILLSDFGIATMLQNAHPTANQKIIGTATYMSPEQFHGHAFPASDQYSLAVIAYEWLAGECPFTGSVSQIATQHMQDPPPSLCKRNPQISPALEQVVFQALAKYPAQRFASVTEFADAFADASPQQALVLRGPSRSPRQQVTPANNDQTTFIPLGQAQQNHTQATPPQQKPGGGVSRRAVVVGLAGLTTVGIAGAAAWAVNRAGLFSSTANNQATTQATRTPASTPAPTTGKLLTTYTKHNDVVTTVAWMPGNSGIVASGSKDRTVHVWHSNGGADIHSYTGHDDFIEAIAWSPDGQFIASASDDSTVHVWTAQQDGLDSTYNHHTNDVRAVAWSHDSQLIASGSKDTTVRIWNAQNGNDMGVFVRHTEQVWAVAWSSDNRYIASAGDDKTIRVWTPATLTNQDNGDGEGGNSKHNRTISTQATIASFTGSDSVRALAWSPDNARLASGGADDIVRIWSLNGGTDPVVTYKKHGDTVLAIAWSPDGQKIASASADGTVHIWKASDGSDLYIYKGHNGNGVNTVAWSADGKYLASGGADKTVQIWSA
jgi:eukaryotic-like serine/threonine-protein kinase